MRLPTNIPAITPPHRAQRPWHRSGEFLTLCLVPRGARSEALAYLESSIRSDSIVRFTSFDRFARMKDRA